VTVRGRIGRAPRGVTLLEVLLVLALLVVLAATAWPSLGPAFGGYELRKSADQVRVQWNRARVRAMSTGQTVLFHYSLDTSRCWLQTEPEPEYLPGGSEALSVDEMQAADAETIAPQDVTLLPERITFTEGEILDSDDADLASEIVLEPVAAGEETEPVVFYPDGTASSARIVLSNEQGRSIEVSLRGLTGVSTVSDVFVSTEPMQ
jgi:prepilin-type N-terminal cleavage/methylation domain-containing protein